MSRAKFYRAAYDRRLGLATLIVSMIAASCLALTPAVAAADDDSITRDLTVEQTNLYTVQAPAVAATDGLNVVAWVDHADNTYAVGEAVRLFVRSSKDAYLTVLNIGPSGNTTLLFPNAFQKDSRVAANTIVEIPSQDSGASIRVSGPSVGPELIKVIASTSPQPLIQTAALTDAGPFSIVSGGSGSVSRDLQVVMDAGTEHEWDDYNKVISTIAERPMAAAVLVPAPEATQSAAAPGDFWIATNKSHYKVGEAVSVYARAAEPCYLTLLLFSGLAG